MADDEAKITDLHKQEQQAKKVRKAKDILAEIKAAAVQKETNEFKAKLTAKVELVEKQKAIYEAELEGLQEMMNEFDEKFK